MDLAEEEHVLGGKKEGLLDAVLPDGNWATDVERIKTISESNNRKQVIDSEDERFEIIKARHCNLTSGHFGITRTLEKINKDFY